MKITISAAEMTRFRAALPGHNLDGLTNVTFQFDVSGNVVDCKGTALGVSDQHVFAGPDLPGLCKIAHDRYLATRHTMSSNQPTAVILPFRKKVSV